jgi:hypothetical protein
MYGIRTFAEQYRVWAEVEFFYADVFNLEVLRPEYPFSKGSAQLHVVCDLNKKFLPSSKEKIVAFHWECWYREHLR